MRGRQRRNEMRPTTTRRRRSQPSRVEPSHKILTIDVGGSHVKMICNSGTEERRFDSGPELTARDMAAGVRDLTRDWDYDVVAIGYPGPVIHNRPLAEPHNL